MIRTFCLAVLTCLSGLAVSAQPYDAGHARVELIAERAQAMPGESIFVALDMTMDPEWHVYWRNPGDAGLAPELFWDASPIGERTSGADFVWPVPKRLPVVPGEIMDYGYDDRLTLPFAVTVPEDATGSIQFEGIADYLICKDVCIPESAPISLEIAIGDSQIPNTAAAVKIADALAKAPSPFEGTAVAVPSDGSIQLSLRPTDASLFENATLQFFPHGDEIVHAADQIQEAGSAGGSLTFTAATRVELGETLSGVVLIIDPNGSRIGYTVDASQASAVLQGTTGQRVTGSQSSDFGVTGPLNLPSLLAFALLGGLILNLMPCVLPVLSIKANGLLHAAQSGTPEAFRAHGVAYTVGVLAAFAALAIAFIGLRSVGEFWALGSLLQYPAVVAGLALAAFVLGLWLLGVIELGTSLQNIGSGATSSGGNVGAFATGALAATAGAPCVGPFVAAPLGATLDSPAWIVMAVYLVLGLGMALPFLVLSFFPSLANRLPKPGAWMERVKQFFAFPMFITAAGLLVVLGDQAGSGAVGWLVAGAALIGFGIWALNAAGGAMRPVAIGLGAIAILAGVSLPLASARTQTSAGSAASAYTEAYADGAWSPDAVAALTADGKGVFVDFTATWCMICQANKRSTLTRADVRTAFEEAGISFLVADFTNKDPAIADELQRRGRPGVPMYLLFAPGEDTPKILPQTLTPALVKREIAALTTNQ